MLILVGVTVLAHRNRSLEETTSYLIEGFQFGFKVFGSVIPITMGAYPCCSHMRSKSVRAGQT